MAKQENKNVVKDSKNTTAAATTNEGKKTMVKRTNADLKNSGEKGKIIVIARAAMSLANSKNREGLDSIVIEQTDESGKKKTADVIAKEGAKQLAGRMNLILRQGGKLELMDEKSESYDKLKSLAQKALPELKKANYGTNVKAFLNHCLTALSVGSGKRSFNPGSLQDIEL